jgi:adenylate cyclase
MQPVVHFVPSDRKVCVPRGTSLLEAVRRAGLPIARACSGDGACGRCGLRILVGGETVAGESPGEVRAKARNRVDADVRLACRIGVDRDLTVTSPYW